MPMNNEFDIAIVGMSGRFPGARNLDEFWHNLAEGIESIIRLSDREILESGVPASYLKQPTYVKAARENLAGAIRRGEIPLGPGERIEWTAEGKRTGRHFLCPENKRGSKARSRQKTVEPRDESHRRQQLPAS